MPSCFEYTKMTGVTMAFSQTMKYKFMKDVGLPALMALKKKGKPSAGNGSPFGPPLKCRSRLKEIMTRHYYLSRLAPGVKPVAWVTSGAPVELLRAFDFYTVYPENHGALCGATKQAPSICERAEERGFSRDICSYARTDLGHAFSGRTPVGKLPRPDVLFCSNNICQTVLYWFKSLSHYWNIPLLLFDTPYVFKEKLSSDDISYMVSQLQNMIPDLERISGKSFDMRRFESILQLSKESSLTWGKVLETLKARPAPMTVFDAFVHMAPIVSLRGLPVALDYYKILLRELEERVDAGIGGIKNERGRLLWDNIAIWFTLRDYSKLFAENGFNLVCATYTNAWAETIHYIDEREPFESLATAYGLVILNRSLRHRLQLMETMIRDYQVDGVVIHSDRSCKPYSVGQYDLRTLLMKRTGVKAVVIEADMTDSRVYSEEQTATRLQAFFESLS